MKKCLKMIDEVLCGWLGLGTENIFPHAVSFEKGKILVSNCESFKRHSYTQEWDKFIRLNFHKVSKTDKDKLGIAIGKAIAKNLVVSFEELEINRDHVDAK